jgi:hypothetical protein
MDQLNAVSWKPAAGETLEGDYLAAKTRTNGLGEYPIFIIDTYEHGLMAVHAFHTVLAKCFAEIKPAVGTALKITYIGVQENAAKTRTYHNYTVRVLEKQAATAVPTAPVAQGDTSVEIPF